MTSNMRVPTAILCAATLLAAAPVAQAVHWPLFGGDSGRSGYQPVGEGTGPTVPRYSKATPGERDVRTSILTSAGSPSTFEQRLVFGTANGRVHLQLLQTGAAVGPEDGVPVDDGAADADVFTGADGSVSFADSSTAAGLGQVFAVHNDDNQAGVDDIAVAQVDESGGTLVRDVPVAGTDGYTISSSVVMTGPAPDSGDRTLFFVATNGALPRLFRIPIGAAGTTAATIGTATSVPVPGANPLASPTLVFLNSSGGAPTAYVAIGTASNLRTFAAADLSAGPQSGDLGGPVQTPTVPVTPSGATPGTPMSGATTAPFIYVAANTGGSTSVYKLRQNGSSQSLDTIASRSSLAGAPAPALATDQETEPGGPSAAAAVFVTTAGGLYSLSADDLTGGPPGETAVAAGSGFGRTTAAASGDFVYVTRDNGEQLVYKRLAGTDLVLDFNFRRAAASGGSTAAYGQPSISRSFVQFASSLGVFVYSNRCGDDVTGSDSADTITGSTGGDNVMALGGDDRVTALTGYDCLKGGDGDDQLEGGAEDDRVEGERGNDTLRGGDGFDRLFGLDGDDRLFGDDGSDGIDGGSGRDGVAGGAGSDRISGRNGDDRLSGGPDSDFLGGGSGSDRLFGNEGDDRPAGDSGSDRIEGSLGNDEMRGGPHHDILDAGSGNDIVFGDSGNDRIALGTGRNRAVGGSGNDRINSVNGRGDLVECGRGRDTARADRFDRVRGCERISRR